MMGFENNQQKQQQQPSQQQTEQQPQQSPAKKQTKYIVPVRLSSQDPTAITQADLESANKLNVWHKIILFNVDKNDKRIVLDTLIEMCAPLLLTPVMYKMETENKATFLFYGKSNLVQKLLAHGLLVKLKTGKVIYFDIILSFLQFKDLPIDSQKVITNTIMKRFGKEVLQKKSLNLTDFGNDPNLGSIYCPMHIPVVFDTIIRYTKNAVNIPNNNREQKIPVRELILRQNDISRLLMTDKPFSFHLAKVDIRDNKIDNVVYLQPFSEYKVTELWLDGNPVCKKYDNPKDYIAAVKSMIPSLQILDGHVIGSDQKVILPIYHKHYINNAGKLRMVKQFLEHFFSCYDQDDRMALNGLYDAGAFFSMTIGPIFDNANKQIIKSFATNRNLLKFVDYAKCTEFLLYGPEKILNALRREPPTLHKLKFLDVDLIFSTQNSFAISVQGPFVYRKTRAPPLWFQRTFIIVAKGDNEFCIINDQYHLDNCPPNLHNIDLSELKYITENSVPVFKPLSFSVTEKYQLLRCLQDLTTMNAEYSDKFLREANWDIRLAIKTFMQTYINNKVPPEAFRW